MFGRKKKGQQAGTVNTQNGSTGSSVQAGLIGGDVNTSQQIGTVIGQANGPVHTGSGDQIGTQNNGKS